MARILKLCVFFILTLSNGNVVASIAETQSFSSHFRIQLFVNEDKVKVEKQKDRLLLKSLDYETFNLIKQDLSTAKINKEYIAEVNFNDQKYPERPTEISFEYNQAAKEFIEVFNFYKKDESKLVVDIWIDKRKDDKIDFVKANKSFNKSFGKSTIPTNMEASNFSMEPGAKEVKKGLKRKELVKRAVKDSRTTKKDLNLKKDYHNPSDDNQGADLKYRDFRYGAAMVWDYPALLPPVTRDENLYSKTPEYFYPIKNVDFQKSEKEAHLQLSINFYRKQKWGLMTKSIKLFSDKYGPEADQDINDFLRASALLKSNFYHKKENEGPVKMAIAIFENIVERSTEYAMRKGILEFFILHDIKGKDFVRGLTNAKKLYVLAKENFDEDIEIEAAKDILYCLALLEQDEQIEKFIEQKTVKVILSPQVVLGFKSYVFLNRKKLQELINVFDSSKHTFQNPIHPSVLFNTAEAKFRMGKYREAIELFDQFILQYSHLNYANYARLRLALSYDLIGEDEDKTLELYKNAINKIGDKKLRYEAKIRYVGVRLARKIKLEESDLETMAFLETNDEEVKLIDQNTKNLLWMVRLRTLINEKKYKEALVYYRSLPIDTFPSMEKKVFEGDGSEIIHGLIIENFNQGHFTEVIKNWENNSENFFSKTPINPQMLYFVCNSYIELQLYQGMERTIKKLDQYNEKFQVIFPQWVPVDRRADMANLKKEIMLKMAIAREDWEKARNLIERLKEAKPLNFKITFYEGVISFKNGQSDLAVKKFEEFLVNQNGDWKLMPDEIETLFTGYSESLYKLGNEKQFLKVGQAIIQDINRNEASKTHYLLRLKERIEYLVIETQFGMINKESNGAAIISSVEIFLTDFPDSTYLGRLQYILAMANISNGNNGEGKKILSNLIKNTKVPNFIKELAKMELSTLEIKNRKI